jgi:hypothetical protein
MKRLICAILITMFLMASLSACAPTQEPVAPTDPTVKDSLCVAPETDNSNSWALGACVQVDTQVYKVTVTVNDEIVSNTQINASGSSYNFNGYGSGHFRMWQEGKGMLPVVVKSVSPAVPGMELNNATIILKTSDLKAMALPSGATTVFVCNLDTEVLSPVQNAQVLTTDRLTYELDDCRMVSPTYEVPNK